MTRVEQRGGEGADGAIHGAATLFAFLMPVLFVSACSDPAGPGELAGPWRSVRVGSFHSCGLTPEGEAFCWSGNPSGQLGDGTRETRLTPTPVAGDQTFEQISAGFQTTCALTPEGEAFCWGRNSFGQVGDGTRDTRLTPAEVAGDLVFDQIDVGSIHTCALTPAGRAFCWGSNIRGRLGNGSPDPDPVLTPTPVAGGFTFSEIDAGNNYTCALTVAGEAFCWGRNNKGQLGIGALTAPRLTPTLVETDLRFRQISTGVSYTCAVTMDEQAYCWGNNLVGQLGLGEVTPPPPVPTKVETDLRFRQISAGAQHTCALTPDGAAFCWGNNGAGAVGDGTTERRLTPVPVSGGSTFRQIGVGGEHTCALTPERMAFCWGSGPIGDGTTEERLVPTKIPPPGASMSSG